MVTLKTTMAPVSASERPSIMPLTEKEDGVGIDDDIYRGQDPQSSPRAQYAESTHSSSSSSSFSLFNGRLGAFTNIVSTLEQALSGWRGNKSSSSSSSSSSRRRRTSNLKRQQSERDFSARISLIKAREESRIIPRQFSLYLAPSLRPSHQFGDDSGVLWTSSLDSVLDQLDVTLKKTTKIRRNRKKEADSNAFPPHLMPEDLKAPSRAASFTNLAALQQSPSQSHNPWFLDVSSPTSEDMRAIGRLLHLHPLTLEDILQQDPREKVDSFPKLGYHFISCRAIESGEKLRHRLDPHVDASDNLGLGLVESNIYIVVFAEGVCSFHFMNASEHIDRVRNRIIGLEKTLNMSSMWIAHSFLDSIVDSFFPFADEIEREVVAIEQLVYPDNMRTIPDSAPARMQSASHQNTDSEKERLPVLSQKNLLKLERMSRRTRFATSWPPFYRRSLRYIRRTVWHPSPPTEMAATSSTTITVRRMARTRRLVTSLTRLLATKSEVVQICKRLLGSGKPNSNNDAEVAIYMEDVQDHILTLQHSLHHFERMLSQSHPTYLQQLNTDVSFAKSRKALVYLSIVTVGVTCLQIVIGMVSTNVHVPASEHSFHVFGVVIAIECLVLTAYIGLVSLWWNQAKKQQRLG